MRLSIWRIIILERATVFYTILAVYFIPNPHDNKTMQLQNNYIKDIRKSQNLTQSELADRVGTTQETIQRLENGKRRLTYDWIKKIADALAVHPSEITEGPVSAIPRNNAEKHILEAYRELSEQEQKIFGTMLRSFSTEKE
ncbi:MAG: hypothetical protein AUJ12_02300 [Alphaproteobacteria bacterium CG1_02_46_17]|nr:MAG: hypothetical protein AUJ12_02300 [Alphaproteobacteria bacterium CG1_02_46_17]